LNVDYNCFLPGSANCGRYAVSSGGLLKDGTLAQGPAGLGREN